MARNKKPRRNIGVHKTPGKVTGRSPRFIGKPKLREGGPISERKKKMRDKAKEVKRLVSKYNDFLRVLRRRMWRLVHVSVQMIFLRMYNVHIEGVWVWKFSRLPWVLNIILDHIRYTNEKVETMLNIALCWKSKQIEWICWNPSPGCYFQIDTQSYENVGESGEFLTGFCFRAITCDKISRFFNFQDTFERQSKWTISKEILVFLSPL